MILYAFFCGLGRLSHNFSDYILGTCQIAQLMSRLAKGGRCDLLSLVIAKNGIGALLLVCGVCKSGSC